MEKLNLLLCSLCLHEEEACPNRRGRGADDAWSQGVIDIIFHCFFFRGRQGLQTTLKWRFARQEVNGAIIRPMMGQ